MRSLAILERLAKQAVDRERRALRVIVDEITEVEDEITAHRATIERETTSPLDIMTSGVTLTAFVGATKDRIKNLENHLEQLREAYDAQLERVKTERIEEKRYATLAERRKERMAREAAEREQRVIDELAAIRHSRP